MHDTQSSISEKIKQLLEIEKVIDECHLLRRQAIKMYEEYCRQEHSYIPENGFGFGQMLEMFQRDLDKLKIKIFD